MLQILIDSNANSLLVTRLIHKLNDLYWNILDLQHKYKMRCQITKFLINISHALERSGNCAVIFFLHFWFLAEGHWFSSLL